MYTNTHKVENVDSIHYIFLIMKTHLAFLAVLFEFTYCRDFYVGMFKKNDFLVAQDTVYKEKNSFGYAIARYGRVFHCPVRVVLF